MIIVYLCIFNNKTSSLGPEFDAIVLDVYCYLHFQRDILLGEGSARAHILHLYTQFYFLSDKRLLRIYYYYFHRRHLLLDAYVCTCCVVLDVLWMLQCVFADSFTNCVNGYHTIANEHAKERNAGVAHLMKFYYKIIIESKNISLCIIHSVIHFNAHLT